MAILFDDDHISCKKCGNIVFSEKKHYMYTKNKTRQGMKISRDEIRTELICSECKTIHNLKDIAQGEK